MNHIHSHDHGHDHDHGPSTNEQIWQGKLAGLAVREREWESGKLSLVGWASALYSYRNYPKARAALIGLKEQLLDYAHTHFAPERGERECADTADEADVISTILVWMRGAISRCYDENTEYTGAALKAVEFGLRMTKNAISGHTRLLLLLTKADIYIRYPKQHAGMLHASGILRAVRDHARSVSDRNQRSRIYRKLGMLLRTSRERALGWHYGIRAIFVPGVPLAVRVKGVVALTGFGS